MSTQLQVRSCALVATLVAALLVGGVSSAEVPPACETPTATTAQRVIPFHPDRPETLARVDALSPAEAVNAMAVCIGADCSAERVKQISTQRGWRVPVDHDYAALGPGITIPQQPLAADPALESLFATQSRTLSGPVAMRQTATVPAGLAATAQALPGGNFVATMAPQTGGLLRRTLMLFFPLLVLGLGGTAVYIGYRQRPPAAPPEPTESEQLAQYRRQQHGRRRHAARS